MPRFKYDVFLSFSSLNESMAKNLYDQLCRSGLEVFWSDDTLQSSVGRLWPKVIEEGLGHSRHMVLLWTDEAMASPWVEKEYTTFDTITVGKIDRLLIPVLEPGKGNDTLPLFLQTRQTYPLKGDLEKLITSLGGRFVSVEQENEQLRQELAAAKTEIRLLSARKENGQQAELERLKLEREEWQQKFVTLENMALEQSINLTTIIKDKEAQLLTSKKRIALLEKRLSSRKKSKALPSVKAYEKTITDDYGIEFMLIEPGTFMMGSIVGRDNEAPIHQVEITKPYYLSTYPITQAQWEGVMGHNPSNFIGHNHPVDQVSWNDAQEFIKRLKKGSEIYRLPTESEWEYACRAGSSTEFSFGNTEPELGQYAWYRENSLGSTQPVGLKEPNPWGLYDMHGNVWEWVADWYDKGSYKQFRNKTGIDPTGPDKGADRVFRGGSWGNDAPYLRSAYRNFDDPGDANFRVGMRLLRTIP